MSRRNAFALVFLIALVAVGTLVSGRQSDVTSSSFSRGASGWMAARRYLEERAVPVRIVDAPLAHPSSTVEPGAGKGTLVVASPLQRRPSQADLEAVHRHLRAGGDLVLAYSGLVRDQNEDRILESLDLAADLLGDGKSLLPWTWWQERLEPWQIEPEGAGSSVQLVSSKPRRLPVPPESARILYRAVAEEGTEGLPAVFEYPLHRGRVWVLPAAVLSNGRILEPGHLTFLEVLRTSLAEPWSFDEYHHGLTRPELVAEVENLSWDLLLLHFGVLYLLAVWALGRRFGPPWSEEQEASGSSADFLLRLGALHHRLGHHAEASGLLLERARTFDPDLAAAELEPGEVRDGRTLVAFARAVSEAQEDGRGRSR